MTGTKLGWRYRPLSLLFLGPRCRKTNYLPPSG